MLLGFIGETTKAGDSIIVAFSRQPRLVWAAESALPTWSRASRCCTVGCCINMENIYASALMLYPFFTARVPVEAAAMVAG